MGLGAESNAVKQQDLADARRSGFFNRFGSFENQQLTGSQARLGGIRGLQDEARGVDAAGLSKEERELRLRGLNERQQQFGIAQQDAQSARAGGPRHGERQFGAAVQQVRVEIADRKNFDIQLKVNEDVIVNAIVAAVAKAERGLAQRVEKDAELKRQKERGEATQRRNTEAQQLKNSKPT